MKKIALLFTIVCVGQLNGMEAEHISELPKDIHSVIIQKAIESSDNLEEAIKRIKKLSVLHNVSYDNLKNFTKLVHALADRFDMSCEAIANKFGTLTAKEYLALSTQLMGASRIRGVNEMKELLSQGADPNFTSFDVFTRSNRSPLNNVFNVINYTDIRKTLTEIKQKVQLLFDYGAIPNETVFISLGVTLSRFKNIYAFDDKFNEIRQMLEKAMQKQQQQ